MYQVGTDIGNPHEERQGTGYATVLSNDTMVNKVAMDELAFARAKKEKERQDLLNAHKQMASADPDNWYVHDKEVQGLMTDLINEGGSVYAKGTNPWTSTDDASIAFQKKSKRVDAYVNASKQLREDWTKLQGAYKSPEDRGKIENWDEIVSFYANPSVKDIVDNGKRAPEPVFRAPAVDSYKVTAGIVKTWSDTTGKEVMSKEEAFKLATEVAANPAMKEGVGGGFYGMKQQQFNQLDEADKEAIKNRGQRAGRDPMEQYIGEQLYSFKGGGADLAGMFAKMGQEKKLSLYEEEKGDVTIKSEKVKFSNESLRKEVQSKLDLNYGQVDREVDMKLYGDPDKDYAFNMNAAVDYYTKIVKDNTPSKYSRKLDEGGKDTGKAEKSFEGWWKAVNDPDNVETRASAIRFIDKENLRELIPDMKDTEEISDVGMRPGGEMTASVIDYITKDGRQREVARRAVTVNTDGRQDMFKNAYSRAVKDSGRHFGTTETGSKAANPEVKKPATSTPPEGFLNKRK